MKNIFSEDLRKHIYTYNVWIIAHSSFMAIASHISQRALHFER